VPESVIVRQATNADLDALAPLLRAFAVEDHHDWDEGVIDAARGLLGRPEYGVILVAVDGTELIGYAVVCLNWSLESRGLESLLDEIYVEPGRRGRSIGRRLVGRSLAHASSRGATRMNLEVEAHNDAARRLYERLGFVADHSTMMQRSTAPPIP
jgi:ribosomal protein S18 acetylase RimI-like enzyme